MTDTLEPLQEDLLRSAFLAHPDAATAWPRWRDSVDWDGYLDYEAFALLPAIYRNLRRLGVDDPLFPRFKGIARQSWLANQQRIADWQDALNGFARNGVELLLLPPTARLAADPSSVMNRAQSLRWGVRENHAEAAVRCLLDSGWRTRRVRLPLALIPGYVRGTRFLQMENGQGESLDLTWGLEWWFGESVAGVWERASHALLGKQPARCLAATDAFEYVVRQPATDDLLGRMIDLLSIAANAESIDWDRLNRRFADQPLTVEQSSLFPLLLPFLSNRGGTADSSRWSDCPPAEASGVSAPGSALARYRQDWTIYRRAWGQAYRPATALIQLPGYLMGRWQLGGPWQLGKGLAGWLRFGAKGRP